MEFLDITTIIFLVVAVFIFIRLRSVLGTRTGHERPSPLQEQERRAKEAQNDESISPDAPYPSSSDNVVTLPERSMNRAPQNNTSDSAKDIEKTAGDNEELAATLQEMVKKEAGLRFGEFVEGASSAYEMIVTAFADEDLKLLKNLLAKDVYESFKSVIEQRRKDKHHMDYTFIGFKTVEIVDAQLDKNNARISVKFAGESISATKNEEGELIEGDGVTIEDFADIWSFARNLKSSDPNWKLVGTSAG